MKLQINQENAQRIADAVSAATFAKLADEKIISEDQFKRAERKALLELGYQPAVYFRKMNAIWDAAPWAFKAFEYVSEEDFADWM